MNEQNYLKEAVKQAVKSVKQGGFPAGAIIVKNNKIIAKGVSLGFKLNDPTSHAETASIRKACKNLQTTNLKGAVLYASLQPCLMCFSAAYWAGISKIVFGCKKTETMVKKRYYEGKADIYQINKKINRQIKIKYLSSYKDKIINLIKNWEEKNTK